MTERVYYTERGIMEICRWSRQPKANEFMDWVWDIVENYRHNISSSSQMLAETITNLNNTIIKIQEDISLLKENAQKKQLPEKKYSRWKTNTFKKLNILTQYVNEHSDQDLQLRDTIHITIEELEDIYNIDLSDYVQAYKSEFGLEIEPYAIDVIHHYKEIRETYTLILDRIMKKLNLQTENNTISRNIFDTLAAELCND